MWAWRVHVSVVRSRLVRPFDCRQAFASGRRPLRVLVIGSGPAVGWGVGSHDLGLPGTIARALAAATERGVVVNAVPHPSAGVKRLRRLLDGAAFERYDAIVLSGALADALRLEDPEPWEWRLRELLIHARSCGPRPVVWLGAQPVRSIRSYDSTAGGIVDAHARRLNALAREVCHDTGALYVGLDAPGSDVPHSLAPEVYRHWGRQIVDALAPASQERAAHRPPPPSSGADRVEAIDRLELSHRGGDRRLDGIVGMAQRTLGAEIAMLTILDDRTEWPLVAIGSEFGHIPIEQSVCLHTIQATDGMIVTDSALDDRFSASALATGPASLRYYAGYPVEAPDGTRIGALCVFGRSPRGQSEGEADLDVLRDLALLAQRELWRWAPAD